MPSAPSLWCAVLLSALAALLLGLPATPPVRTPGPATPDGHLVLVIEGTVRELRVTAAVAKPDPCQPAPPGLAAPFRLQLLDGKGAVLDERPLDLSAFDLDPARIGGATRVEGCSVRSPSIGVLASVPDLGATAELRILHGTQIIGSADAVQLERLRREGPR